MTSQDRNAALLTDAASAHTAQRDLVSMARDALAAIARDPLGEDVETGNRLVAVGERLLGTTSQRGRAARERVVVALTEEVTAS